MCLRLSVIGSLQSPQTSLPWALCSFSFQSFLQVWPRSLWWLKAAAFHLITALILTVFCHRLFQTSDPSCCSSWSLSIYISLFHLIDGILLLFCVFHRSVSHVWLEMCWTFVAHLHETVHRDKMWHSSLQCELWRWMFLWHCAFFLYCVTDLKSGDQWQN